MVNALAETQGAIYFTDEELLRALGADDEELVELAKLELEPNADESVATRYSRTHKE